MFSFSQQSTIYHKGWIDFNKNNKKDIFEDTTQTIDKRVEDLLSEMSLEEKTCQMATLYGYGRVLKDEMPTPAWKNAVWKDGIANIDEELNGVPLHPEANTSFSFPFSRHANAINTIQKWFVEETRLGVPVDFTNEGVHGLCSDRATPLPAPISIGATWNKKLVRKAGEIVGREAKALGYSNVYAPILDPARDQRWGRVVECYGEGPFLIAELGKQMTLGIQSQGIASTLKHFAV
jgi:beta-glucosidase